MKEFDLQKAVTQFLMICVAPSEMTWRAVPNGEYRSPRTAGRLKASGVRPGVGDFSCTLAGGRAAWIELKTDKGRQSPAQREFQKAEEALGARYAVVRSLDELQSVLRAWGVKFSARVTGPDSRSIPIRRSAA